MNKFYKYFFLSVVSLIAVFFIYCFCVMLYFEHSTHALKQRFQQRVQVVLDMLPHNHPFKPIPHYPKHKVIRILVLEGGGMQGIISLKILAYLSRITHKPIHQLFDVMVGTSVGAMQAAALSLPAGHGIPQHTPTDLLRFMENTGPEIFHISLSRKLLTGLGLYTPIINTLPYARILQRYFGHIQLSQLTNWVILFGYNIHHDKVAVFDNHGVFQKNNNFLLSQLLLGITAIPNIMPPQEILSFSQHRYYLSDPTFVINNPTIGSLILINKLYPHNPKMIVFLGLGRNKRHRAKYVNSFFNGFISSPHNVGRMTWATKDKLIQFYLETLENQGDTFKLVPGKNLYINESLPYPIGPPTDASDKNIKILNQNADAIIKQNKTKLAALAKNLIHNASTSAGTP